MILAEERYDAVAAAAQADWDQRQLSEFNLESAAINALRDVRIARAEAVTLDHIAGLRKMGKLTRRLSALGKKLEREQGEWAELDEEMGQ